MPDGRGDRTANETRLSSQTSSQLSLIDGLLTGAAGLHCFIDGEWMRPRSDSEVDLRFDEVADDAPTPAPLFMRGPPSDVQRTVVSDHAHRRRGALQHVPHSEVQVASGTCGGWGGSPEDERTKDRTVRGVLMRGFGGRERLSQTRERTACVGQPASLHERSRLSFFQRG
jgi:hypothetical protein